MSSTVTTAIDQRTGLPLYEPPSLSGALRYRDQEVRHHGSAVAGFANIVHPGRRVVEISDRTWPATRPEECTDTSGRGEWLDATGAICDPVAHPGGGVVPVRPECGLDCT